MSLKMFDMFTGIGGFSLAAKRVFGDNLEIIGFSEIDKYAIQIYNNHFQGIKNYGDATTIIPNELPDFDILTGGFPCQAFSIAGKRLGFEDTRGTLFFDIIRICADKQPKFILLENVKGLLNHSKGRTFQTILETLNEAGYYVKWDVYNSKHFGVPQNRERIYFQCFNKRYFGTGCIAEIFYNQSEYAETYQGENSEIQQTAQCLTTRDFQSWKGNYVKQLSPGTHQANRIYDAEGCGVSLKALGDGQGAKTGLYKVHSLMPRSSKTGKGGTGHLSKDDDTTYCLDTGNAQAVELTEGIRRLTPIECERLQGYPDNWTSGISDNQRYKCCGNSITVNVAQYVFSKYKNKLQGLTK